MGIKIEYYDTDNGCFVDNMKDMQDSNQTISFCGVEAHHQNSRAEKKIRDPKDNARKMLLHVIARWPKAMSIHL